MRCNCDVGVPENSRRFEPCPRRIRCGKIWVQTFDELFMPKQQKKQIEEDLESEIGSQVGSLVNSRVPGAEDEEGDDEVTITSSMISNKRKEKEQKALMEKMGVVLPLVLRFIILSQISHSAKVTHTCIYIYIYIYARIHVYTCANIVVNVEFISATNLSKVCKAWNYGTNKYQAYVDMRDAAPWQWYRPHVGSIDALVLFRNFLFSSGDRRVLGSDIYSGETLGQVTRDSGKMPVLLEKDGYLYSCSSNGKINSMSFFLSCNLTCLDANDRSYTKILIHH